MKAPPKSPPPSSKHAVEHNAGGGDVTAVLNERYSMDNQLHRRLQQRIHHSPHVYTELALTDASTVLQVQLVDI